AAAAGGGAQVKEESCPYAPPELAQPVHTIGIGLDGTCMLLVEDGYRQAMVGTVTLYDREGERLHTLYVAATPEYGKDSFQQRLVFADQEVQRRADQEVQRSGYGLRGR